MGKSPRNAAIGGTKNPPMPTKQEFEAAAHNELSGYPVVAQYVRAGDPRVLAQIGANAAMLAMLSEEVQVAKMEAFAKTRDSTVMADAAMRGILPLGRACRVTLQISNSDTEAQSLASGRRLLDSKGRTYELDSAVNIPAGGVTTATARQIRRRSHTHSVLSATDFYLMDVPMADDDYYLNTLVISKGATTFDYKPDWFNVKANENSYGVEVDELRNMRIVFGRSSVIGYGVQTGDEFTIDITECAGRIKDMAPNSEFNLEYIQTSSETNIKLLLSGIDDEGAGPNTIQELRVMAQYPAIYDKNAVYLGEFEFLLRQHISGIRFLSVWNEQTEEKVRGFSVDNINKLFVAGIADGMTNAAFEERVRSLVFRADSSYPVRFVPTAKTPVKITVTASVAISWDRTTIEAQIRALLLETYGEGAIEVSKGQSNPLRKNAINTLLRENIDALRDEKAEFDIQLQLPASLKPEQFLYLQGATAYMAITVTSTNYGSGLWNV